MQYGANLYCTKKFPRNTSPAQSTNSSQAERNYLYWSTKYLLQGEKWNGLNGTFTTTTNNETDAEEEEKVEYEFKLKEIKPFLQRESQEDENVKEYTIAVCYERIQKQQGQDNKFDYAIVKIDWTIDVQKRELHNEMVVKDNIWIDMPYQAMAYSWRHVFLFVMDKNVLKFWAFQNGTEQHEDVEWREDFVEMFQKTEPLLFAIEHANVTKVVAIVGTFLHAFDFYEHGLSFEESMANAQQTFNIQSLKNDSQ